MRKHILFMLFTASIHSTGMAQQLLTEESSNPSAEHSVEITGFDCANEMLDVIPLLGRGSQFPDFLIRDIDTELKRQHAQSALVTAHCNGQPELLGATAEGADQELVKLSITFDLSITVDTGKSIIPLEIKQQYLAENLHTPNEQKVTQNFIVQQK